MPSGGTLKSNKMKIASFIGVFSFSGNLLFRENVQELFWNAALAE